MNYNEYLKLADSLNYYSTKYYVENESLISDFEYDELYRSLLQFEKKNPNLVVPHSPSFKVGAAVDTTFESVIHEKRMLSLENTYNIDELYDFNRLIIEGLHLPIEGFDGYVLEPKIDGLSISVKYEQGKFVQALTRGDGKVGEDVTPNVRTIKSLPLVLAKPVDITVRGEVFIPKSEFEKVNQSQLELGRNPFSNPRNAASGSLRQKDSKISATRGLDIFVFDILSEIPQEIKTHDRGMEYLKELGFKTISKKNYIDIKLLHDEILKYENMRDELDYEIDGMVIKVNSYRACDELGSRTKTPKWAVAYKFKARVAITKLLEISVRVGRSGAITPRARFEPVQIGGSTVEYATLHNQDYIDDLDIRIGDMIEVEKAADVIPKVVGVLIDKRDGSEIVFRIPEYCPDCGTPTIRVKGESAVKCPNPKCPAKDLRALIHFCSKSAMDIDGLGEAIITQLVEEGFIADIADIYTLSSKESDLIKLERMEKRKVSNLLHSIENSKLNSLEKLLSGLGIPMVGERTALDLAKHFKSMDEIVKADEQVLLEIDEIGDKMSKSIFSYFRNQKVTDLIERLKFMGVNMLYLSDVAVDLKQSFEGEVVVLTGKLEKYSRDEAQKLIEDRGGKTSSSVSKKTTIVLTGESSGSKLDKAKDLGIRIMNEREFEEMISDS